MLYKNKNIFTHSIFTNSIYTHTIFTRSLLQYCCILFGFIALVGCTTEDFTREEVNAPLIQESFTSETKVPSYIKIRSSEQVLQEHKINIVGQMVLSDALRRFLPEYQIIPLDSGVFLEQKINLNAINMPVSVFISTLAAQTGLDVQRHNKTLEFRSFLANEWLLGALSGGKSIQLNSNATLNKGLDTVEGDAALTETLSYDEWDSILESAKQILGDGEKNTKLKPYVRGVRSLGKITAGGSVQAMNRLNEYLSGLQQASTQQVAIEVQAYDVTLTDDRASGVNWQEFAALGSSVNGNPLNFGVANSGSLSGFFVPNALQTEGVWQAQAGYQSSRFSAQGVLQFLNRFGDVELLNQPNLTVRNGGFALMHAGDQLSYIADTEVVREGDGPDGTVAVSATVEQLKVGVSLAVSPKLLDDNRILLNIWPVVSSVQGFDEFQANPIPVRVPRLALQELSTEVIVESGKTIQLGGLIRKSVSDSLQTLPFRDGVTGALLKPLFNAQNRKLERRELVLLVTPRLVR